MTTQRYRKGHSLHIREDRERTGPKPRSRGAKNTSTLRFLPAAEDPMAILRRLLRIPPIDFRR